LKEKEKTGIESEKKLESLEKLILENGILSYNPTCVRKKSNWSQSANVYKFDSEAFDPQMFLKDMPEYSPKLNALMKKIAELDHHDKRTTGKLYKHFIFSDLKSGTYGAKMIASAFLAKGYRLGYKAEHKGKPIVANDKGGDDDKMEGGDGKKRYHKIELLDDQVLHKTHQNNFYMLSSVGVYDQNIAVASKKEMLKKFNQRPENIHGDLVRFIVLDSGFKEGIDLLNIK